MPSEVKPANERQMLGWISNVYDEKRIPRLSLLILYKYGGGYSQWLPNRQFNSAFMRSDSASDSKRGLVVPKKGTARIPGIVYKKEQRTDHSFRRQDRPDIQTRIQDLVTLLPTLLKQSREKEYSFSNKRNSNGALTLDFDTILLNLGSRVQYQIKE